MGTTARLALPYPELTDPADVPADVKELADRLDLLIPARVTALPGSPADGLEVVYVADASNGVLWHLRYNASGGTYKWEFVGGGWLQVAQTATFQLGGPVSWSDLANMAPLTVPLAGEYVADAKCTNWNVAAAGNTGMGIAVGAGAPTSTDGAEHTHASGGQRAAMSVSARVTVAAGGDIRLRGFTSVGGGQFTQFENRRLRAQPARVG